MPDNNELNEVLDAIIQDRTFSLEAVEAIKDLRDKNERLEDYVKKQNIQIEDMIEEKKHNEKVIRKQSDSLDRYFDKEKELTDREAKITQLEKDEAVARAQAKTVGYCFDTIFKNTVFREEFNKRLPGKEHGGPESGDVKRTTEPGL